jgi:hypothetical protein
MLLVVPAWRHLLLLKYKRLTVDFPRQDDPPPPIPDFCK